MSDKLTKSEQTPMNLMELAINQNADIEKLEKLMSLQEQWETKESKKLFFQAMADFQLNKPDLKKTKKVEFNQTKYKYAPLPELQKLCDPIISKYGLSYRFEQTEKDNKINITCIVTHESGHSEKTSLSAPLDNSGKKNVIQSLGSTVSYLKRYTFENAFGLSANDDNDGKDAPSLEAVKENDILLKITDLYVIKSDNIDEKWIEGIKNTILERKSANYNKVLNYLNTL